MDASASQHDYPPEVVEMANRLNVDPQTIMAQVHAAQQAQAAAAAPAGEPLPHEAAPLVEEPLPHEVAPLAEVPVTDHAPVESVPTGSDAPLPEPPADAVSSGPGETETERLQRELAESRQETQQVRKLAQTAQSGRVVGSGGVGVPRSVEDLPNLGSIEPGLRYDYLNGNITDEQLAERLSPLLAALLKKHSEVGGSI